MNVLQHIEDVNFKDVDEFFVLSLNPNNSKHVEEFKKVKLWNWCINSYLFNFEI